MRKKKVTFVCTFFFCCFPKLRSARKVYFVNKMKEKAFSGKPVVSEC